MTPIFVDRAAKMARVRPEEVSAAMTEGRLVWKRFQGQRATTRAWLQEWLNE